MLHIDHLSFQYTRRTQPVLNDFSLQLKDPPGQKRVGKDHAF